MIKLKNILFPTDFSQNAKQALRYAPIALPNAPPSLQRSGHLCFLIFTLCSMPSALSPMRYALCAMPIPRNSHTVTLFLNHFLIATNDKQLNDEHRITITIEPVFSVDRLLIGIQYILSTGKSRYQH